MKKIFIILNFIIVGCSSQKHNCDWEECVVNEKFKKYSDIWCIQDLHQRYPDYTYEQCEYILFVDCKDTLLNN